MDSETALELIDVDKIFKRKNRRIYSLVPGFIIEYIKKTIHQDEINNAMILYQNNFGLDFLRNMLSHLGIKYTVKGEENIPPQGRFIFVGNHPLGGLDGMIFMELVGRHYSNIKTISNDILMNIRNLQQLFIPVNKHGKQTSKYIKDLQEIYKSNAQVISFPAGLCSRKTGKTIMDLEWKKSFIKQAIQYQRDVIPVKFEGKNSDFFYRLANIRKALGIKFNMEMFYLPDEMFKQSNQTIKVTFGKPIPYTRFSNSKTHLEWAAEVKNVVYNL